MNDQTLPYYPIYIVYGTCLNSVCLNSASWDLLSSKDFLEVSSKNVLNFSIKAVFSAVAAVIKSDWFKVTFASGIGIFEYTLALSKEMLGYVRGKYSTVPIPNSEVTLNGSELVTQGQTEKDALITQLREFLDKLTKESMMTRQQAENDAMNEVLSRIPTKIYVG